MTDKHPPPQRSSSAIIEAYTEVKQQLELELAKKNLNELIESAKKRRENRRQNLGTSLKNAKMNNNPTDSLKNAERYRNMEDHKIPLSELYQRLGVDPEKGLDKEIAIKRNKELGNNILTERKKTPWPLRLLKELTGFFSILLLIGAVLCFIANALAPEDPANLYLGIVIISVVLLTGIMTFYQNSQSDAIMESFKNFIPPQSQVFRNETWGVINATKLVPGDIIKVKYGDRIPADIRIIFSQEMKVDNSSLTGESDPLLRSVECTDHENPLETANLAFFGTLCKEGEGKGIVVNIGDNSVLGQIANLASSSGNLITPLRREMDRFILIISVISFVVGIVFFAGGFIFGYPAITNLLFGIGIIVANVPEGLCACITISLTIAAKRLATRKVLVKNLEAVEALGSTTCICSDKTGTLTQNKMTVENLWYDGEIKKGVNLQKKGKDPLAYDINSPGFITLQENAVLCSEASFNENVPSDKLHVLDKITNENEKNDKRKALEEKYKEELESLLWLERPTIGDASETALIKFFQPIEDIHTLRSKYPIRTMDDASIAKIPFNSSWKYSLTICNYQSQDSVNTIFIKGAPEKIWALCKYISLNGKKELINDSWNKKFEEVNRTFGEGGQRVLGFARLALPNKDFPHNFQFDCKSPHERNYPMTDFVFSGLISLIDPPRESVPFAISKCKTAGIKVIMVTGDQPVTAAAIAREVGIFGKNEKTVQQVMEEENLSFDKAFPKASAIAIHGDDIMQASKEDELLPEAQRGQTILNWLSKPRIVFARTTPAQKLIIVKACQQQGHIVAVTGDGVNDSPAIKKADIGISMGITGSDVAKDAADMILLNDDFAAIVIGIEEGRRVFDNLKKSIMYCMGSNVPEIAPFIVFIIFQMPLALSTVLVLAIDMGTDIIPSIALSSEESELDIMVRPPRKQHEHLFDGKVLLGSYGIHGIYNACGGFLAYFLIMKDFGIPAGSLFGLAVNYAFKPGENDIYDPNVAFYGMTNPKFIEYCTKCWEGGECDIQKLNNPIQVDNSPDWIFTGDSQSDLRLWYLQCAPGNKIEPVFEWAQCSVKQISRESGLPVCYSTEMLKHAHTAFFASIVYGQYTNALNTKTRKTSFMYGGLDNFSLIFGFYSELLLIVCFDYVKWLNVALGTRPVILLHWGFSGFPFVLLMLLHDEIRKYLTRNVKSKDPKKPNWFFRNTYW